MKRSFKSSWETRRIRLKRHSNSIYREIGASCLLACAAGILAVIMTGAYFYVTGSSYFQMEKPIIKGCSKVSDQEILKLCNFKPDQSLLNINSEKVVKNIRTNPWIEEVRIYRQLPSRLCIDVKERRPVALMRKDQTLYYVDANANPFKKIDEQESAELPILTGFSENGQDKTELIRKSLEILSFFSSYNGFPRLDNISEVHGDEDLGFSIYADNGIGIRLGFGNYEDKLKRLKTVMVDLSRRDMTGFFFIDLSNPVKITVQKKEVPLFPKFTKGYKT